MSISFFARRGPWLALGLLLAVSTPQNRAEAASLAPILSGYWNMPNLEYANGNKVAVGRFNHLYTVLATSTLQYGNSDIEFVDYDPVSATWTDYQLTFDGMSYQPTVAVDTTGRAVVAWINRSCLIPTIYYAYQSVLNCPTCWSQPKQITFQGAEPAIAAEGGVVHLTWTTRDRVQYMSFPTISPPSASVSMGNVVDVSNCANTQFYQPSIALAHPPCSPLSVRISALLIANEQQTVGTCHTADTKAGPRVYERDNTTLAWSQVFQEVVSNPAPNQQNPVAISSSMNANRLTGDFYLAWSDEQNLAPRTWVGHGKGTAWDLSQPIDNQRHHVHVGAKGGGSTGHFRLAVSDPGWSTGAYSETGRWNGGLTWTGPSITIPDSTYGFVGHPQALYWSRCASSTLSEVKIYTEAGWTTAPQTEVATDWSQTGPVNCRLISIGDAIPFPNCFETHLSIAQMVAAGGGREMVLVDFGDSIAAARLSETGAQLTTLDGGTIQATWAPGEILSSWENGFTIATRRDSIHFSSTDAHFTVEDAGVLSPPGKPGAK